MAPRDLDLKANGFWDSQLRGYYDFFFFLRQVDILEDRSNRAGIYVLLHSLFIVGTLMIIGPLDASPCIASPEPIT